MYSNERIIEPRYISWVIVLYSESVICERVALVPASNKVLLLGKAQNE